jgi:hypothetical protein
MSQSQVWKKRPAGLASEFRDQSRTWLNPKEDNRQLEAVAPAAHRKAGLKQRKFSG